MKCPAIANTGTLAAINNSVLSLRFIVSIMEKGKIFFSYSRSDSDFALKLAQDLRSKEVQLWIDQLDIKGGSRWDSSIETALNSADSVLVILTPTSISSNNVMDEVSFALENNKSVVPILLIQCVIPFRLRRLQYIDFTKDYQKGLTQLLETLIQTDVGKSEPDLNGEVESNKDLLHKQSKLLMQQTENINKDAGKFNFKKFLFIGIAVIIIAITFFWVVSNSPSNNDVKSWNIALKENDSTGFANYLKKFPNGKFVISANAKLDSITNVTNLDREDDDKWAQAITKNTIAFFQEYKNKFPQGRHLDEANQKLDSFSSSTDTSKVSKSDVSTNYYQEGISFYQKGKYQSAVEKLLKVNTPLSNEQRVKRLFYIGQCYDKLNEKENALKYYGMAINLSKDNYSLFFRAQIYMDKHIYNKALIDYKELVSHNEWKEEFINSDENDVSEWFIAVYYNMGICKLHSGDNTYCDDFKKAAELGDKDASDYVKNYCDK